jgi:hypothetical protein
MGVGIVKGASHPVLHLRFQLPRSLTSVISMAVALPGKGSVPIGYTR